MKRKILFLVFIVISVFSVQSCEENFSSNGEFEKKYSLNCVVRGDTNLQITSIFTSFSPEENPSTQNANDYFVENAFVRLWCGNDEIYYLKDTLTNDSDSTKINRFYYTDSFNPKFGVELEIEALLPDGNRLKSKTYMPNKVRTDLEKTTAIISPDVGDKITFSWLTDDLDQIYIPTLSLYYREKIGDKNELRIVKIPWKYQIENGKEVLLDKPPTRTPQVEYEVEIIDRILRNIADTKNADYITILSLILELKVLDKNLSAYYLASGRIFDNYSIRLDSKDFSNISGGSGIFGSFIVQKMSLGFAYEFLAVYGY